MDKNVFLITGGITFVVYLTKQLFNIFIYRRQMNFMYFQIRSANRDITDNDLNKNLKRKNSNTINEFFYFEFFPLQV